MTAKQGCTLADEVWSGDGIHPVPKEWYYFANQFISLRSSTTKHRHHLIERI
jgi:hypothetical protein